MGLFGWKDKDLSHRILMVIVTVAVVLFALFFFVGYSHPYSENPDFIEPKFTNVILWFMMLVFILAVAVTVWAVVVALLRRGKGQKVVNKVPVAAISAAVVVATVVIMVGAFVLGSSSVVDVNGKNYEDPMWLKAADMFVISSLILMILATAAVAFAAIRSYLNRK